MTFRNTTLGSIVLPAAIISLTVGSVLTLVNQGSALTAGSIDSAAIVLNFFTPFCVSAISAGLAQRKADKILLAKRNAWRTHRDTKIAALTAELETERQKCSDLESASAALAAAQARRAEPEEAEPAWASVFETVAQKIKSACTSVTVVENNARRVNETSRERVQFIDQLIDASESCASRVGAVHVELHQSAEHLSQTMSEIDSLSGTVTQGTDGLSASKVALEQMSHSVAAFNDQFGNIGSLSETVSDIARQTGLLSINASVEAARAGEHGRGFAIVATEVRDLAGRSSAEVANINEQVRELNEGLVDMIATSDSVEASLGNSMEASQKAIDHISRASETISNVARDAKDQGTVIGHEIETLTNLLQELRSIRGNTAAAITGSQENINLTHAILDELAGAGNLVAGCLTQPQEQQFPAAAATSKIT